jgi:hypothetical protein
MVRVAPLETVTLPRFGAADVQLVFVERVDAAVTLQFTPDKFLVVTVLAACRWTGVVPLLLCAPLPSATELPVIA